MVNRVLLTGAGFTANFNTPLAAGVANLIFNNVGDKNIRLRQVLTSNYDYEDIYQKVIFGEEYTQDEKNILNDAVKKAYEKIDQIIVQNNYGQTCYNLFNHFILRFSRGRNGSGYIFTLNQDLFIERKFNPDSIISSIELPAVGVISSNGASDMQFKKIPVGEGFVSAREKYEKKLNSGKTKLMYIKLHGSSDWVENDNHLMMIGTRKNNQIAINSLLNWYSELFHEQLNQPETRLFIIGYGFNDEHINQALANAKDNLKITILDVKSYSDFMNNLQSKPYGHEIKNLISKFYKLTLSDLFPKNPFDKAHPDWKEIQKEYFDIQEPFLN